MERELMTVTEASRELGISTRALLHRLERGQMYGERIHPRLWMIPRAEVEAWRDKGKLPRGPKPGSKRGRRQDEGGGVELDGG